MMALEFAIEEVIKIPIKHLIIVIRI